MVVDIIVAATGGDQARFAFDEAFWGFRPIWVEDDKAPRPINARAESVARSRYFRDAFRHRRCLVPADGWYEWKRTEHDGKQPYYATTGAPLAFAGLYTPMDENASRLGLAVVTEPARGSAKAIHPRMPVVLDASCWSAWLDPSLTRRESIRRATARVPSGQLQLWPVSARVNSPSNDDPSLIEPDEGDHRTS